MSYSQNDEEQAIKAYFSTIQNPKRVNRFLDVGAHDGVSFSNTRALAELGWSGVLVEPSPGAFCELMECYRSTIGTHLVNAAVVPDVPRNNLLKFWDSRGDFVSTFDEKHRSVWAKRGENGRPPVPYQPIYVSPITMKQLFTEFPGPYSFVNIDVEGINFELFAELPFRELEAELICVEHQNRVGEIEDISRKAGFIRYHTTTENLILAKR